LTKIGHNQCTPPAKIKTRHIPSSKPTSIPSYKVSPTPVPAPARTSPSTASYTITPLQHHTPPPSTAPPTTSRPRFGSSVGCPGCHKSVSAMERGVVPGPKGTRWHSTCLICGGKDVANRKGRGEDAKQAGCGKRLDSAAKSDGKGGVWCRECLSLLPDLRSSPHGSPAPCTAPHASSYPGIRGSGPFGCGKAPSRIITQSTGATTLAQQFTGIGASDVALMRQLTGGGLSPTRHLAGSPTKQFGIMGASRRPRPKSVIGMGNKSIDEGRGMYLVRQMTGVGE